MIFKWFKIFNLDDFLETGLTSRTYTAVLSGVGQKSILVTKGNLTSLTVDGVMLAIELNDANPFVMDGLAVYIKPNQDVFLGILQ